MKGALYLEDGTYLEADGFAAEGVCGGEIVFNTAMMGYQEMISDPSYCGQILMFTSAMIGNYGVNQCDNESSHPVISGCVINTLSAVASNWRSESDLAAYLTQHGIVAIEGIDVRYVTQKIRQQGAMKAVIATGQFNKADLQQVLEDLPSMEGCNLVQRVSCQEPYIWDANPVSGQPEPCVVVLDCGVKWSILRQLRRNGCRVVVMPVVATFEEIASYHPDGLVISNGPGDPSAVPDVSEMLVNWFGRIPLLGICLGHQLLGRAVGGKTFKLPFGHHGANHPVKNLKTGKIEITSHNHGFAVEGESLEKAAQSLWGPIEISHRHLSDDTIEGFHLPDIDVTAIQYHPEAAPGPHDAHYIISEFVECIKKSLIG